MTGTQQRALDGIATFQLKTLGTLTENEDSLPPPQDGSHTAFGRLRRRLREMSARVLRLKPSSDRSNEEQQEQEQQEQEGHKPEEEEKEAEWV
jgi:hypothetical protein